MKHLAALVVLVQCCLVCLSDAQAPSSTRTFTVEIPAAQQAPTPPDAGGKVPEAQLGCMAIPVSDTPAVPERAVFNVTSTILQLDQWLPSANSSEVTSKHEVSVAVTIYFAAGTPWSCAHVL